MPPVFNFFDADLDHFFQLARGRFRMVAHRHFGDVLGQPHPELVQNLERRDVRAHQPDVQREQCPDQSEKSDNAPIHDQLPVDAGRTLRVSEQLLDNFVHRHKRGDLQQAGEDGKDAGSDQQPFFLSGDFQQTRHLRLRTHKSSTPFS
ncbi:hypothetical protein [Brevibacillus agri]|uniref:hypothetical protein n=1 Tax=Brevibacillus agri TaxID=51101 RepID=UPI0024BFCF1B|nr:hypothetical protein [Brevibacillus agri]WHX28275.1 hypothetical protein QNK09_14170 [Brevibacillus agri]